MPYRFPELPLPVLLVLTLLALPSAVFAGTGEAAAFAAVAVTEAPAAEPPDNVCHIDAGASDVHLSGLVSDPKGAVVSGASVTLSCNRTQFRAVAGPDGRYRLAAPAGVYQLTASAPGFALPAAHVELNGTEMTRDLTLQLNHVLSEVTVTDTDSFVAVEAQSANKTDTPLLETPQMISVITNDQMTAQGVHAVSDALRYTPGVNAEPYGNDPRYDWMLIRGFTEGAYGVFLDGMNWAGGSMGGRYEPYGLEQIDVLKGPSSVLYGQNAPGGLVNMTTKRPQALRMNELGTEFGSFDRKQLTGDFMGAIDAKSRLLYRVTGLARLSNTQVRHVPDDRLFIAPALTWNPTDKTSITVLGSYQKDRTNWEQFMPAYGTLLPNPYGKVPVDAFYGEPGWDNFHRKASTIGYLATHRFNPVWTVRQNFRKTHAAWDGNVTYGYNLESDMRTFDRLADHSIFRLDLYTLDNQAQASFATGRVRHNVLLGVDYTNSTTKQGYAYNLGTSIDLFSPVYGSIVSNLPYSSLTETSTHQTGLYVQDQVKLTSRLIVTAAGRYDTAHTDPLTFGVGHQVHDDHKLTGKIGASYVTSLGLAPYFSVATSFLPTDGVNAANTPFKPTTGIQYEAGVKYQPRGMNSFVTVSFFNLRQQNVVTSDPANPTLQRQTGETRSRGVEVEGTLALSRALKLRTAYTFDDVAVTRSGNASEIGKRPTLVPENTASLWAEYSNPRGMLAGLGVNAGVRFTGLMAGSDDNSFWVPSRALVDAGLFYEWHSYRLAVNTANLFDRTYVGSCLSLSYCNYGYGRNVTGSLRYRWGGEAEQK